MSNYLKNALTPETQREPLPGQIANNAGGFAYQTTEWTQFERFLILGSEGGSYYATQQKLTKDNAKCVSSLLAKDGVKVVETLVAVSESGRAPKNDPAILALALAAKTGDLATRQAAYAALPRVCRTGTHLYHFVSFANDLGGWGRGLKRAVANWFNTKKVNDVAYQLVKYQARDGWSARDLLRLSHPTPSSSDHAALYKWVTQGADAVGVEGLVLPPIVEAFEEAKSTDSLPRLVKLITDYRLPRECITTEWLTKPEVWAALLPHMGLTAMIRNLGTMTKVGLLEPFSAGKQMVVESLANGENLRKSRVHPLSILNALVTYKAGRGFKGSSTWKPVTQIVDALDAAFYTAFQNVTPTGKNTLLGVDVSGSMDLGTVSGMNGITPRIGAAAMALVTANVEPNYHIMGFSHQFVDIPITPKMRLDDVVRKMQSISMGGTDCALPITWASKHPGAKVESFATYTDSETWAGSIHPSAALKNYRTQTGLNAKNAIVGFTATNISIADPNDSGMMDFVGFDTAAPAVMADFFRGQTGSSKIDEAETEIEE